MKPTLSTMGAVVISCVAAAGGIAWLASRGISIPAAVVISLCGGAVLAGMLILGSDQRLEELQKELTARPAWIFSILGALWGLYFVYSIGAGTAEVQPLIVMAVYLSFPFLLLGNQRGLARGTWLDAVAILWMWLPIELGIVRRLLITSAPSADFHYAFAQGLAINAGITAFAAWRRFPGIGYRFQFDRKNISIAVSSFLLLAAIAIPLGFAVHFIRYTFELGKLIIAPGCFLASSCSPPFRKSSCFEGLFRTGWSA